MLEYYKLVGGHPLEPQVEELVDRTFGEAFGSEYWRWKYRHPVSQENTGIYAAGLGGRLTAVLHYVRGEYRIGPDMVVPAAAVGDLVVDPEFRGRTVAGGLSRFGSQDSVTWADTPELVLMWTRPRLGRFYTKNVGFTRVPPGTIRYEKQLDVPARIDTMASNGTLEALSARLPVASSPTVELDIEGLMPVLVAVRDGRIRLLPEGRAAVRISGPPRLIASFLAGAERRQVWMARLGGRLRVRGPLTARRRIGAMRDVYLTILEALTTGT